MNIIELQDQADTFNNRANRLHRVGNVFTATIYGGAAAFSYGAIDSIAEQDLNLAPTAAGALIIYGGTVLSFVSKTFESLDRITADNLQNEIDTIKRNRRLRNHEVLKRIGLSSRFSAYQVYK